MAYETKNYDHLLGTDGFSDNLLKNHFTLYDGYVKNTNKVNELSKQYAKEGKNVEYAELKRRFGWEFNGMRLHEYYFDNLKKGGSTLAKDSELAKKINENFGSVDDFLIDFKANGAMRGIGWVILSYDRLGDHLYNTWINEHDLGHLAGATPLLVMDVFEHAFITDYGLKRADYIAAFVQAINWEAVQNRL